MNIFEQEVPAANLTIGQRAYSGRLDDRPEGAGPRVVVVSPPFYSHARALATIGGELRAAGARPVFATGAEFAGLAAEFGLAFQEFESTTNRNTGIAGSTVQAEADRARLLAFMRATRRGPIAPLLVQSQDRRADMLARPTEVLRAAEVLHRATRADWYLVDQLSYPVTLALHCLGLPFATYCPGHPSYLPVEPGQLFGVPPRWPDAIRPEPAELARLRAVAGEVEEMFTEVFNETIAVAGTGVPQVERAFTLASDRARLFTYPQLPGAPARGKDPERDLYQGHCVPPAELDGAWRELLDRQSGRPRVLIALGTFFNARDDVLRTAVAGVRAALPDALIVVGAGESAGRLAGLADATTLVEEFVPQRALLPRMDLMVHHGGNNSFTECLRAGVPAVLLPFASDQFAIAHDAEALDVGRCADPNRATPADIAHHVTTLLGGRPRADLRRWSAKIRQRGPGWGAREVLRHMPPGGQSLP